MSNRRHELTTEHRKLGLSNQIKPWARPGEPEEATRERFFHWWATMGRRAGEIGYRPNMAFWQRYATPADAPLWAHRLEARLWTAVHPMDWPLSDYDRIEAGIKTLLGRNDEEDRDAREN